MKNALSLSGRLRQRIARALLGLAVVVGALASTATPAHAATFVIGCFQRPSLDPTTWTVRVDLRVWNPVQKVLQPTGQYVFIKISNAGPTCPYFNVPPAYQNYYTTMIVDYRYTQNGATLQWYGWSGQYAPPGAVAFPQNTAITKFTNLSSVDGILNIHTAYWH